MQQDPASPIVACGGRIRDAQENRVVASPLSPSPPSSQWKSSFNIEGMVFVEHASGIQYDMCKCERNDGVVRGEIHRLCPF
jgi:hypothetical protein